MTNDFWICMFLSQPVCFPVCLQTSQFSNALFNRQSLVSRICHVELLLSPTLKLNTCSCLSYILGNIFCFTKVTLKGEWNGNDVWNILHIDENWTNEWVRWFPSDVALITGYLDKQSKSTFHSVYKKRVYGSDNFSSFNGRSFTSTKWISLFMCVNCSYFSCKSVLSFVARTKSSST